MNKLLDLRSITKAYGVSKNKVTALRDATLSLSNGDFVSLIGPSGSGKSTLLHIAGGLEPPDKGSVIFKEKNIYRLKDRELSEWRNKKIGFIFQFYHLIEELNVLENIAVAAFGERKKYTFKKAEELLEYLDIKERKNSFPSQLSGGEKQRVAIARALINDPQILLCDEPTGNLDYDSQQKVVQLLEKLNNDKGKTILLVTHNLELAKMAKRTLFIKGGSIK